MLKLPKNPRNGKPKKKGLPQQAPMSKRPVLPYFQDPVYHFVSRQHREASLANNQEVVQKWGDLMHKLSEGSLPDNIYFQLEGERRAEEQRLKQERKKHSQAQGQRRPEEKIEKSGVNVAELKKRVFNPQTSPENMVKALEALPVQERKKVIGNLTAFLRSKIQQYLKSHGY